MKITVGIPAFNEEKNIAKMIVKLKKISDEISITSGYEYNKKNDSQIFD